MLVAGSIGSLVSSILFAVAVTRRTGLHTVGGGLIGVALVQCSGVVFSLTNILWRIAISSSFSSPSIESSAYGSSTQKAPEFHRTRS